jgi:hypothetical protein
LTAAACDTIIADYIARLDAEYAPPTTTEAPKVIAEAPFAPGEWVSTDDGFVIADRVSNGLAAYYASADSWNPLPDTPFGFDTKLFAARGFNVFVMGSPASSTAATMPFAMLDAGTERWRMLAPVPDAFWSPLTSVGDSNRIFGVGVYEGDTIDKPPHEVMLRYDIAQNHWTKLPPSPLSPRAGSIVQWTGKELLVWGGGDSHQGGQPAYSDGAAYNPATGTWRTLPIAPVPARLGAASVWTGTEMLVWGGSDCQGCGSPAVDGGAAYNPETNRWRKLAPSLLTPSFTPAAVWTGTKMVVLSSGLRGRLHAATYAPATDTWMGMADPSGRSGRLGESGQPYATWFDHQAIFGTVRDLGAGRDELAAFSYTIGD